MVKAKKTEFLIALDILLGCFLLYDGLKISRYVLSLLIQLVIVKQIMTNHNKTTNCNVLKKYILVIISIFLIATVFAFKQIETILIVNRIFPLISIFGFYLFLENKSNLNLDNIINLFVKWYIYLVLIINIDCFAYLFLHKSIWEPISWLGLRFGGPFGDPNFAALFSAVVLIIVINQSHQSKIQWLLKILILIVNIVLARSLSTFLLIPASIYISKLFKHSSSFQKQIIIISIYAFLMTFYEAYSQQLFDMLTRWLTELYGEVEAALLKYSSLEIRLDTQVEALKIFLKDLSGQGPHQLVPQLQHDTHNSYVSIAFENGILGILLIFMTLRSTKSIKVVNQTGTFLMLSALLLNVHEMAIYSLFIIMQGSSPDNYAILHKPINCNSNQLNK